MLFVRYKFRHLEHNNTTLCTHFSDLSLVRIWWHNKMSQCQIFTAQTALVCHLLSEIRISHLHTWYRQISLSNVISKIIENVLILSNEISCSCLRKAERSYSISVWLSTKTWNGNYILITLKMKSKKPYSSWNDCRVSFRSILDYDLPDFNWFLFLYGITIYGNYYNNLNVLSYHLKCFLDHFG